MRVKEIVIVHLSHSHGFAQKRNAFRIHGMAPNSFQAARIFNLGKIGSGSYLKNEGPVTNFKWRR